MAPELIAPMLLGLGAQEMWILLAVVVLIFGAKKLPELARGSGQALRIFKAETKGLMDDDDDEMKSPEQLEVDQRRAADQRARLAGLLDAVDSGEELSPLPPVIVTFYATLLEQAPDEALRRRIRAERDFAELGFYRGALPPESVALFDLLDTERIGSSLAAFGDLARDLSDAEVQALSDDVIARIESRLGNADLARRVDTDFLARLYEGFIAGTDGAQSRIAAATLPKLLAAIEDWRTR